MDHGPAPRARAAAFVALPLIAAALAATVAAQAGPGAPDAAAAPALPISSPVARFMPDIDVYPSQYAVAQDGRGIVYVGNEHGVLSFDGERWSAIPSQNGDLVRSLAYDGAKRVYVGGYGAIGWLERDARGVVEYHDLTASIPGLAADERFADVWETTVLPQGVFFRALHHVFRYQPDTGRITVWRNPTRFGALASDGDELILNFRPLGLRRLVGDEWQAIPGTEVLNQLIERWIRLADGRLLALHRDGRWWTYHRGKVEMLEMPAAVGSTNDYTRGLTLADGTLALTGDDGTLRVVDLERGTTRSSPVGSAFVSGLIEARDGGLLLSLDSGLHHVDWLTPWATVDLAGALGSIQGVATWGARRVLLTGAGAFEHERSPDGDSRFVKRDWAAHGAWDLIGLDRRSALLADNYALRLVDGEGSREISSRTFYPRAFWRSRFDPDTVFVGTELGLGVVRRVGGAWRLAFTLDDLDAPTVNSLVELERGEVMIGTERGGAWRLRFADGWTELLERTALNTEHGLGYGRARRAWLTRFELSGVVASTERGFFRFDGERFVPTELDGLAALRPADRALALAESPDGTRWAWDFARIFRKPLDAEWRREEVDALRQGAIERVYFEPDGAALFIASGAVLRHDPTRRGAGSDAVELNLTSVERVDADGAHTPLPLDGAAPLRLAQGDFGIAFRFATPELRRPRGARYRARLVGSGEPFSEWSRTSGFTYHRLNPGRYRLEVQARDSRGIESELRTFEFEITPRWYASRLARTLWVVLGIAALGWATRLYIARRTRRLAAEKSRLEGMVEARTRELADANRKLDTIAHLDGLTGIPNRRRLDEYLEQVWALCGERERPLALLAIDVDRFKDYNDKHGHLAGDTLLKRLAPILTRNLRRTEDLAARYGGEEFLVVLPGADAEVAREVAEALREKVASSSIGATVSIGVAAETPRAGRSVTELVALADAALYKAKDAGRDRVVVSGA